MSPERRSPRAPAQDIWPHVTTMQHSGNHYTIRHKVQQKVYKAIEALQISCQAWLRTEFNWQRKTAKATAWSGSTPQVSGWATDPSTVLLHLLAKSGNIKSQSEYNDVLASKITTRHEQSGNHATSYPKKQHPTTWQQSTQVKSASWHEGSMA